MMMDNFRIKQMSPQLQVTSFFVFISLCIKSNLLTHKLSFRLRSEESYTRCYSDCTDRISFLFAAPSQPCLHTLV